MTRQKSAKISTKRNGKIGQKEDWIRHQSTDEQARLGALSVSESDHEFALWCLKKSAEFNKKLDELREQGILPPLKGLPNYKSMPGSYSTEYFDTYGRHVGTGISDGLGGAVYYDSDGSYRGRS